MNSGYVNMQIMSIWWVGFVEIKKIYKTQANQEIIMSHTNMERQPIVLTNDNFQMFLYSVRSLNNRVKN